MNRREFLAALAVVPLCREVYYEFDGGTAIERIETAETFTPVTLISSGGTSTWRGKPFDAITLVYDGEDWHELWHELWDEPGAD